jgi:16S rRNA (guanine527-N7)-methyltransferase
MKHLSDNQIAEELRTFGVSASPQISESISTYISLLLRWNSKISLTTVTDPVEIVRFHFGESMFAASCTSIREGRLADVGTGAGFPGLPLKLIAPELSLFLIESNTKKAAFVSEVSRELQFDHVEVYRGRMETVPASEGRFDFVAARALGMHQELLAWSRSHLPVSGRVLLWLGERDAQEMLHAPEWNWSRPMAIPRSQRRFLLIGQPS